MSDNEALEFLCEMVWSNEYLPDEVKNLVKTIGQNAKIVYEKDSNWFIIANLEQYDENTSKYRYFLGKFTPKTGKIEEYDIDNKTISDVFDGPYDFNILNVKKYLKNLPEI